MWWVELIDQWRNRRPGRKEQRAWGLLELKTIDLLFQWTHMKRMKILYASDWLRHRRSSIAMEPSILLPTSGIHGAECQDCQKHDQLGVLLVVKGWVMMGLILTYSLTMTSLSRIRRHIVSEEIGWGDEGNHWPCPIPLVVRHLFFSSRPLLFIYVRHSGLKPLCSSIYIASCSISIFSYIILKVHFRVFLRNISSLWLPHDTIEQILRTCLHLFGSLLTWAKSFIAGDMTPVYNFFLQKVNWNIV